MSAENTSKPAKSKKSKPKAAKPANGAAADPTTALVVATPAPTRRPPVRFSDEIAEVILAGLRDGKSLREICEQKGMPDESSVRVWASKDTPFAAEFKAAKDIGHEKQGDDLIALADDMTIPPDHKRIMVDTRKWKLSKMLPKIYGDKIELDHKGGVIQLMVDAEDLKA